MSKSLPPTYAINDENGSSDQQDHQSYGGTEEKPVGTVWFAWAVRDGSNALIDTSCEFFSGDRELIRELTVAHALQGVLERIES